MRTKATPAEVTETIMDMVADIYQSQTPVSDVMTREDYLYGMECEAQEMRRDEQQDYDMWVAHERQKAMKEEVWNWGDAQDDANPEELSNVDGFIVGSVDHEAEYEAHEEAIEHRYDMAGTFSGQIVMTGVHEGNDMKLVSAKDFDSIGVYETWNLTTRQYMTGRYIDKPNERLCWYRLIDGQVVDCDTSDVMEIQNYFNN